MPVPYFRILDESAQTGRYLSSESTAGPWSPEFQHGGPPNALAVAAAERVLAARTGRADLIAVRLATEFIGPVPVAEVGTTARVVRAAGSAALVEVMLRSGERDCLHSRVWFVRDRDTAHVAPRLPPPVPVPGDLPGLDSHFGYERSLEWRVLHGGLLTAGPGAAWARPRAELTDGVVPAGLQFAALLGDSAGGLSSELDWQAWSFQNVDLDVHLARPIEGEWLLLDAVTQLGGRGSAVARSTLSDVCGAVGSTLQTLVLAPRAAAAD